MVDRPLLFGIAMIEYLGEENKQSFERNQIELTEEIVIKPISLGGWFACVRGLKLDLEMNDNGNI